MKRDMAEIENMEAVKEYKFITQQLHDEKADEPVDLPDGGKKMVEENNLMKFKISKLDHANGVLRTQLELERKKNKELRSDKSNYVSGRNELEGFFLECIEEVKKDIQKRKDQQAKSTRYSNKTTAKSMSSNQSKPRLGVF